MFDQMYVLENLQQENLKKLQKIYVDEEMKEGNKTKIICTIPFVKNLNICKC
ncbi:hypothetical protein [Bacillus sp. 03113]|uniref:hypothetical protein n=1 Tax=Bacillus sp. 03113 TaxID=2578211 RepID=UPI0015E8D7DC|nr:hypothetical protein [Bacillus sp. 03113]